MKRGTIRFWSRFPRSSSWDLKAVVIVHDVEELKILDVLDRLRLRALEQPSTSFKRFVANCGGVIAAQVVRELSDAVVCLDLDTKEKTDFSIDLYSVLSTEKIEWQIVKNGLEMNGRKIVLRLA